MKRKRSAHSCKNINRIFIQAITTKGMTDEEYQRALHAYLTDPSRTQKVSCYCKNCLGRAITLTEWFDMRQDALEY